jgi:phosphate transport system protein
MRQAYQTQLGDLLEQLAVMCDHVGTSIRKATDALLNADLSLAEEVISGDARIDELRNEAEHQAFALLALQAPVATDLRMVVTTIHAAGDLERMGDLALHVARAARRRHPAGVLPEEIAPYFAEMGRVACEMAGKVSDVIRVPDVSRCAEVESEDDALDDLHKHMFTVLMGREWTHGVAAAVDVTLLARFYERYGDHAVLVARRMVYVITGQMPTTADA